MFIQVSVIYSEVLIKFLRILFGWNKYPVASFTDTCASSEWNNQLISEKFTSLSKKKTQVAYFKFKPLRNLRLKRTFYYRVCYPIILPLIFKLTLQTTGLVGLYFTHLLTCFIHYVRLGLQAPYSTNSAILSCTSSLFDVHVCVCILDFSSFLM